MSLQVLNPFDVYMSAEGAPLNGGKLYIGVPGQDPQTNPQACFWDADGLVPATQPIDVQGGYTMHLGSPARLYTALEYSIRVRAKDGTQVFYEQSVKQLAFADISNVDPATARGYLNVPRIESLEKYARIAGINLFVGGSINIQPAIDLAVAAQVTAASSGGLRIFVPDGMGYTATSITVVNKGGFYCNEGCVGITQTRDSSSGAETYFVALSDQFATDWIFFGFRLYGGWSYGRNPYNSAPETDPWLDKQHCCAFIQANSGVSDATYIARSFTKSQIPRGRFGGLTIGKFGGDGLRLDGAGSQVAGALEIQDVGGCGIYWNGYDSDADIVNVGATGRAGVHFGATGANTRFGTLKTWYTGQRLKPELGQSCAIFLDRSNFVTLPNLSMQDSYGSGIVADRANYCTLMGGIQWQGGGLTMIPLATAIESYGLNNCVIALVGNVKDPLYAPQTYPAVTRIFRDLISADSTYASNNTLILEMKGWPVDQGTWNPSWFEGPLDISNEITLNGVRRIPKRWYEGTTGETIFGSQLNGSISGMVARGSQNAYAGSLVLIGQGSPGLQLQAFKNTGTSATGVLTATSNFANGDTVTIAGKVYTMQTTVTNVDGHVQIGAAMADSLNNLANAINDNQAYLGTAFAWRNTPHPSVTAVSNGVNTVTVTARTWGTAGNAITTTKSSSACSWGAGTMSGGAAGTQTYYTGLNLDDVGNLVSVQLATSTPYANDAAAGAAGLTQGRFYRTAAGAVMIKL